MNRMVVGTLLAVGLAGTVAGGAVAQDAPRCRDLSAEDAQTLLDQDPTYEARARLDPDGDGVACEPGERGDRDAGGGRIGGGGRTATDAGPPAVTGMPGAGVGDAPATGLAAALAAAAGLAALGGVATARRGQHR